MQRLHLRNLTHVSRIILITVQSSLNQNFGNGPKRVAYSVIANMGRTLMGRTLRQRRSNGLLPSNFGSCKLAVVGAAVGHAVCDGRSPSPGVIVAIVYDSFGGTGDI